MATFELGTYILENCICNSSKAEVNNGGCIYASDNSVLYLSNWKFENNYVLANGAAIALSNMAIIYLKDSSLSYNNSTNGGAIYCEDDSHLEIEDCDFFDNEASLGGALYIDNTIVDIFAKNTTFR